MAYAQSLPSSSEKSNCTQTELLGNKQSGEHESHPTLQCFTRIQGLFLQYDSVSVGSGPKAQPLLATGPLNLPLFCKVW